VKILLYSILLFVATSLNVLSQEVIPVLNLGMNYCGGFMSAEQKIKYPDGYHLDRREGKGIGVIAGLLFFVANSNSTVDTTYENNLYFGINSNVSVLKFSWSGDEKKELGKQYGIVARHYASIGFTLFHILSATWTPSIVSTNVGGRTKYSMVPVAYQIGFRLLNKNPDPKGYVGGAFIMSIGNYLGKKRFNKLGSSQPYYLLLSMEVYMTK
jgi:hypothetical protein